LARSRPIVLTSPTDASFAVVCEHLHSGTQMPSGGVHPIGFVFRAAEPAHALR
jgi:hypothetical protein